jgi:hypothetical protein
MYARGDKIKVVADGRIGEVRVVDEEASAMLVHFEPTEVKDGFTGTMQAFHFDEVEGV